MHASVVRTNCLVLVVLLVACGGAEAPATSTSPVTTAPATSTAPATIARSTDISVTSGIPGSTLFVTATLERDSPLVVVGCVSSVAGACAATARIVLDDDAPSELDELVRAVEARPRCEPVGFSPGDPVYTLSLAGRSYDGHLPAAQDQIAARTAGACPSDARLAWWIARFVVATSRTPAELPSRVDAHVDVTTTDPRFVTAWVEPGPSELAIVGCTSGVAGSCRATRQIVLDATQRARFGALLEDVRSEPCHVPFPIGAALEIDVGLVYDGRCGADAELAWWMARLLDPDAMHAPSAAAPMAGS